MPAMRLSGRRGDAAAQRPMQFPPTIICPVCGLRNDIAVRFCRNCGLPLGAPRDPVRGTTTKRAELPSDRGTGIAAIIGLLIVVAIVSGAGFLIYKGFQGNSGTASAKPSPTHVVSVSAPPATSPLATDPAGSVAPDTTDTPAATDQPSATDTPAAISTVSAWTCKTGAIADPLNGRWRITHTSWNPGASTDRVTLTLTRVNGTSRHGAVLNLAYISPTRAASKYGVTRPLGDHAIVITFDGPITVGSAEIGVPNMKAIKSVDVRRDTSGVTHAIVGISGTGCARMNSADWRNGSDATQSAVVTLDVRR